MQLLTFQVFCDLVDTGSFSLAAERNHITQSAVSQQIKLLEEKFKVSFFERGKRRFSVTTEGEIFVKGAREIVRIFRGVEHELQSLNQEVSGDLRVIADYGMGIHNFALILKRFRAMHPRVNLKVEVCDGEQVCREVLHGQAALGILGGIIPMKGLTADLLKDDPLVFFSSNQHPLYSISKITFDHLEEVQLVIYDEGFRSVRSRNKLVKSLNLKMAPRWESNLETIKKYVEMGDEVALIPESLGLQNLSADCFKKLNVTGWCAKRAIGLIRKQGNMVSPALREFMNHLISEVQ